MIPALFATALLFVAHTLPDPTLTPGKFCTPADLDFKEFRYTERVPICHRNVSTHEKDQIMVRYSLDPATRSNYEIDHCIPLSLGGSNSPLNLWPQPRAPHENEAKNALVRVLYKGLMDGTVTYFDAIKQIEEWCPPPG